MSPSCMSSTNNASRQLSAVSYQLRMTAWALAVSAACVCPIVEAAGSFEREPMTMRVVAVNPSSEKTQTVPVRIDLPSEIGPSDILDHGELDVDYDTAHSQYFVFKDGVQLGPKQTKVFEVIVKDVWFIPAVELDGLRNHTGIVLGRLEKSEYYPAAKQLGDSILARLNAITAMQSDETLARRQRIGSYRKNRLELEAIKEDLARMEKLLSFAGGPPVPQMLEESALKSDAPSTTTTWLVIFLIVIFMGFLAGQFFFTWQRRLKAAGDFTAGQEQAFPEQPSHEGTAAGDGGIRAKRST